MLFQPSKVFTPTIDSIVKFSSWLSVPFALLVMFLSLKLFDAIFCCLDGNAIGKRLLSFFDSKWTAFFLGLFMSIITASVALSLGIFVPLYNRNMIKKTSLIPYIMVEYWHTRGYAPGWYSPGDRRVNRPHCFVHPCRPAN